MIYKSPHIYIFFIFGMKYFPFLNEIGKSFYQGFFFHLFFKWRYDGCKTTFTLKFFLIIDGYLTHSLIFSRLDCSLCAEGRFFVINLNHRKVNFYFYNIIRKYLGLVEERR